MKVKRIIKDDILSSKKLLELAKRVNWNEDKMLDELRKQNPKVSNSDLQAIVESFILKNKTTKDSTTRLKSYNIKNHNTGITYKVKATSYRDAKDKYEKYIKDGNSFTYKGYVIIKSSYGWKVKIGNKIIEFATDKEAKEYIDLHKDTFSEDSLSDVISYAKELERINYRTDEKTIFRALSKGSQIVKQVETHLENTLKEIKKQDLNNYQHKKDVFEQRLRTALHNIYTFYDMRFEEAISEWDNGRITGKRFGGKHQSYMSVAKNLKDKFYSILMKYNKLMKDTFSEDAKWDTLLANLGFAHNQGTGDIQIWKYRDKDRDKFEKAIEHIRRVDRKLILSASSQSSGEHKITIMKPTNDSFTRDNSSRVNQLKKLANTKYVRVEFANKTNPDRRGNEMDYVKYYVISTSPSEYEKTAKLLEQKGEKVIRGLNYNLYIRDSFSDDSTVTISVKPKGYLTSKNNQNTLEEIYNITIKRRSNGDITASGKIQSIEKFLKQSLFDGGLVPGSIKIVKDSLTEDADFYGANQGSEKADDILFALQVMYGEPKYTYRDFQKMNLSQTEIKEALEYVKKKGYNKHRYFDSFSEDATLAQLEIKNTFLEEDDDANEVKYLGFNDDRKISFYEYGDKYFAFFDLENRVEVIEKDEVQRILKKNLIKETDQDKDELFREGDEGIATTVRSENEGGSK